VTKSELINLLAPYGDDEPVVFVTFEDGITVYERVEVARSHATTRVGTDGRRDMPVAIYLVGDAHKGRPHVPG
jgi:hypothetical protein